MQTPLQLDIWLQSYEGFVNAKNNIKQRNFNTVSQYLKNNIPNIRLIHVTYVVLPFSRPTVIHVKVRVFFDLILIF